MADMYQKRGDQFVMVSAAGGSTKGYELCEFYFFLNPTLRVGMRPAYGGVIDNADVAYPEAWAFLRTEEGAKMTVSVGDWTAAHNAVYATTTTGTQFRWDNVGGVAKYALDLANKKLYLPDLRGMYAEPAGFDSLVVGGVHGDRIREVSGNFGVPWSTRTAYQAKLIPTGPFYHTGDSGVHMAGDSGSHIQAWGLSMSLDRVIPIGNSAAPRGFGVLPCVYLAR